jgi:geranylgeranyl pyrophosphate synthase
MPQEINDANGYASLKKLPLAVLYCSTFVPAPLRLAFESKDDILDVEGSTEELGKTVGADEKIQKMTYPRLYGIEGSKEIAGGLVYSAVGSLGVFPSGAEVLRELAQYLLVRKH